MQLICLFQLFSYSHLFKEIHYERKVGRVYNIIQGKWFDSFSRVANMKYCLIRCGKYSMYFKLSTKYLLKKKKKKLSAKYIRK